MTEVLPILGLGAMMIDAGVWLIQLFQRWTGNMIHVLANRFMMGILIISPLAEAWYLDSKSSDLVFAPIAYILLTVTRRLWHTTRLMSLLDFIKEMCSFVAKATIFMLLLSH